MTFMQRMHFKFLLLFVTSCKTTKQRRPDQKGMKAYQRLYGKHPDPPMQPHPTFPVSLIEHIPLATVTEDGEMVHVSRIGSHNEFESCPIYRQIVDTFFAGKQRKWVGWRAGGSSRGEQSHWAGVDGRV